MKSPILVITTLLVLPLASAMADDKPVSDLEACKGRAEFLYHMDMMKIEGQEMGLRMTHVMATMQKRARHMQYVGELKVCEEEEKK